MLIVITAQNVTLIISKPIMTQNTKQNQFRSRHNKFLKNSLNPEYPWFCQGPFLRFPTKVPMFIGCLGLSIPSATLSVVVTPPPPPKNGRNIEG